MQSTDASSTSTSDSEIRRIAAASFIGTVIEWYDFFLYGLLTALIFNELFFPSLSPAVGTTAAFGSFAVGFVARPLGAIVFGHLGDRYGRKSMLIVTVVMMSTCTGVIGLLPTYASIGVAAPVIVTALRFVQGLSIGGEWGGAALLTIEHAPAARRNRYASWVQQGAPIGAIVATVAIAVAQLLPHEQFVSWGWRIPFLFAFPLLGIALYLRMRIEESPLFRRALAEQRAQRLPLVALLRDAPARMAIGVAAPFVVIAGPYLYLTFMVSYGTDHLGMSATLLLGAVTAGRAAECVILVVFGRLADRYSHVRVCTIGALLSAIVAVPAVALIDTRVSALVVGGIILGTVMMSITYAPIGTLLSSLFPSETRYSGVAVSYNLGGVLAGFMPLITQAVFTASGQQPWTVGLLFVLVALVSLVGCLAAGKALRNRQYV